MLTITYTTKRPGAALTILAAVAVFLGSGAVTDGSDAAPRECVTAPR